ncbi:MAG: type I DNA topoisomerase [Pirellulaceae bacterium]|nr:type I DNA topoisomerase [Pirellulaceae bacterium]
MAKNATAPSEGHSLVIVESPAKARTISKFLGKGYTVEASIGHIRDLPQGKKEMPADLKDEEWAKLGVNVNDRFTPVYVVPQDKKSHITKLKKLLKESQNLYLATDEDREGEAISWHLQEVLKPKVPVHRLVFHEITNEAILDALETPREIDDGLVKAQETRRILDRLYGYEISEFLWRKKLGRSAGRVQSVAVRLIVQREWERRAFRSATYWDLTAQFSTSDGQSFDATLVSVDGRKIPSGKDFDSATGQIKDPGFMLMDETGAQQLLQKLKTGTFAVTKMQVKPYTQKPAAPFTTSTMQQEANRKLGFTARRTMSAAQSLYENGYITYMRTDSTSLAKVAVDAARELVGEEYGKDYLPEEPRTYRSTVRNAQEAHEAIRPAGNPFRLPDSLKGELAPDQFKLFELIWKRTVASQMQNARGRRVTITVEGEGSVFQVSGKTIDFPGFLRAYVEGADDPNAELADKETLLPAVEEGQAVSLKEVEPKSHTTQPPSRFSEAALTRELEQRGIGRPSTYASIIETIQTRNYVFKKGNALVPTWNAFSMVRLMEEHFPSLVDYEFTANMEGLLDSISRQEAGNIEYLEEFYFGKETPGLKGRLETKIKEVDPRAISTFPLGTPEEGEHLEVVNLRVGQYGPYLEQGERKASLPEDLPPDELTLESALELLKKAETGDEPLGICPDTHKPVFVKSGRFGPYVQLGLADEGEKPKNAGLLKGMSVEDITLEVALKLLSLPRLVGEHPDSKEVIEAFNGRYGPYIKCGSETRSLPDDVSPLDVQLEQSLFLLSQPKRRGRSAPKEPIKTFESSPITEQPIRLLEGRYGPYVTDGETNASLPKGTETETVTFEQALQLLAERAAKGPSRKKKKTKKKATKKKATKKKATKKKATKKKATKKKSAKKKATKKKAVSAESVDEGG